MLDKEQNNRLIFIIILAIITWGAYFVFVSMGNVFQDYTFEHHLKPSLFVWKNLISLRIAFFWTILLYIKRLQAVGPQSRLFLLGIFLLIIGLCLPLSFDLYPFVSGMARVAAAITEPWLQLYVPSSIRATVQGTLVGVTGILDISCIALEDILNEHLSVYHYFAAFFLFGMIGFWIYFPRNSKINNTRDVKKNSQKETPQSALALLKQHPYVFISFFIGGLNIALFDYTFLLSKEALPHNTAQIYQYVLYAGSIFGPILIGRIADIKGIFLVFIVAFFWLILNKIAQALCFEVGYHIVTLYLTGCIGAALSSSVSTLSVALMGERFQTQGIFRVFVISNVFFSIGDLSAGRIYQRFSDSFLLTNLCMALIDVLLLVFLWKCYKKENGMKSIKELFKPL